MANWNCRGQAASTAQFWANVWGSDERSGHPRRTGCSQDGTSEGEAMAKRARKKKDRRKNNANHGKRPRC